MRAYHANGPVFMVSTRYYMTSVTNGIAFQSYEANARLMATKFGSMLEWYIKSNSENNAESLIDKMRVLQDVEWTICKEIDEWKSKSTTLPL